MTLADVIERSENDLRLLAKALAAGGFHADALRLMSFAAIIRHDVPGKLAVAEAKLTADAALKDEQRSGTEERKPKKA